ncbi:ornithine--oxo-acid transaminase [Nocardioides luteus]|uniref:ornithine aminotransferase n=1 Tax=Nocardioides luteus TaxID=1844 RepID=A0ABQ5T3E1_9ACTN|nr:ornithine--oxo-acid transaminase [Nocardioides luteus]MDR7313741.1 ornithine--oxo-acid transaminase [Nocardioides luteus]GGR63673.1 ornithine--oxo-acid transaminase [Nocardioides luteus]GLJ70410.1 ornithine--oxo-acid transaminase [Nocardioides luteus]
MTLLNEAQDTAATSLTPAAFAAAEAHSAHNYHPLEVVISHAEGAWVTDVDGRRCLDMLAGYSALNFGHGHPALLAAAREQLDKVTLTSRAFVHDQFAEFTGRLAAMCGKDMVLPMNTGAEAVETAIKVARKWGYDVKGVPADKAEIIVMGGNFHGRTTTIVGFSDDADARDGFGPFAPGFVMVPYADLAAIEAAITPNTVAVLVEPIQGESGVVIPADDFLTGLRELCTRENVLFAADEIQAGLGRTGYTFACDHAGVKPDMYILGKALGGGIVPVSAVVADRDVLGVIGPGQHGSTFGGNPLACAVGTAVIDLLETGEFQARAEKLGHILSDRLLAMVGKGIVGFRARGLWAGVDIDPAIGTGREICERLLARGVLAKDTHGSTIRLAPPLVIAEEDLHWALDQLEAAVSA